MFCSTHLQWPQEYTHQKCLPFLTQWVMRSARARQEHVGGTGEVWPGTCGIRPIKLVKDEVLLSVSDAKSRDNNSMWHSMSISTFSTIRMSQVLCGLMNGETICALNLWHRRISRTGHRSCWKYFFLRGDFY